MTHRTIEGIRFIVHSPSHWQLAASDDVVDRVDLIYDGAWWTMHAHLAAGHTVTRDFTSRQAAIDLMLERRP